VARPAAARVPGGRHEEKAVGEEGVVRSWAGEGVIVGLGRGGVVINSYEIMYMVVNYPLTRAQMPCLV
jgi:hypothetical protein